MLLLITSAVVGTALGLIATWHDGPVLAGLFACLIGSLGTLASGMWLAWRTRRDDRTEP